MIVSLEGAGPLYQRVYRGVRELILSRHFPAGSRLPVTRGLARELGVSRNVVLLAYEELVSEGYAVGRTGSGTYVSAGLPDGAIRDPARREMEAAPVRRAPLLSRYGRRLLERAVATPQSAPKLQYDFHYAASSPDDFPMHVWRKLSRKLSTPSLGYLGPQGDPELRRGIARYLRNNRGVECEPEQVLIVNGTQQALDLTTRVLLDPGDGVIVEDPHDPEAREIFTAAGGRVRAIPVDRDGMMVERLPGRRGRLRFALITPSHQFPSGAVLSLQRRLALLAWAARTGTYVLEDDYDSEFRYESRPIEAVQAIDRGQRVIYIGTFSRVLFPALRLGYMVLPRSLVPLFSEAKRLADRHSAAWAQHLLARFISEGHLERHLRKCLVRKAGLRAALLEAIRENFKDKAEILGTGSGVHVLLRFPAYSADRVDGLVAAAAGAGVGIYPARRYYLKPPDFAELVLGYGALQPDQIREGIRLLASLMD